MASSFITRTDGENGTYKVIFDTDNKEHYKLVEDACRAAIDHQKPNVIPVIRCRECMYFRPWRHDRGDDSRCELWNVEMDADDYCAQAIYLNNEGGEK